MAQSIDEMVAEATKTTKKKSYLSEYMQAISTAWAESESKGGAIAQWLLTSIGKPLGDFIGTPIKNQIDNFRVWARDFEDGIKQYSEIQALQEKPYVDLSEDENKVLWEFYEKSKQEGYNISNLSNDKQATLLGIKNKQEQYERYAWEIMGHEWKSAAMFAWQALWEIKDKMFTWRRDGDENIAQRLAYGTADAVRATTQIVIDNIEPLDESERMYAIWNNAEMGNFDKIVAQAESFKKSLNFEMKFDNAKHDEKTQELLTEASLKIWSGLSVENQWSTFARTWEVMAWYTSFFFAPIISMFDEEVTGKTTESLWALLATPFMTLMNASSESLQALGTDKKTADNWGEVIAIVGPMAIRMGKKPKELAKEVSAETAMIANLPKKYQSMYVDVKGKVADIQVFETTAGKQRVFTQREVLWEKTGVYTEGARPWSGISQIRNLWEKFVVAMKEQKFKVAEEIQLQIQNLYTTLKSQEKTKTPPSYLKSMRGFIDPLAIVSDIKRLDMTSKINKASIKKLLKHWDGQSLLEITELAAAKSIAKHTKDMDVSFLERDIMTENLFKALQEKKLDIEKTTQKFQENKELREHAIDPTEVKKVTDVVADKTTGVKENRTTYDLIKRLESQWVIKMQDPVWGTRVYIPTNQGIGLTDSISYPENLATIFDAHDKIQESVKNEYVEIFELWKEEKFITPLEKNIIKSGITPETYVRNSLEKTLKKRDTLAKMETEIINSQAGERVFVEWEVWGDLDVVTSSSTFPKWIPSHLRNKNLMEKVFEKLMNADLDIPPSAPRQREIMTTYLEHLGSPLKDIYDVDLKNIWRGKKKIQQLKEKVKQSKQFARAYYQEYKKTAREVAVLETRLSKLKGNAIAEKAKLREKISELRDTYKNRRAVISAIRKEYKITDAEYNKLTKTKDYLKFKDEYAFKEFAFKLETKAYELYALKLERAEVQKMILEKELVNIENVFRAYELPSSIDKFTEADIRVLEGVIEKFEKGDIFIGTSLMKRFQVIENGDIYTIRQTIQTMHDRMPGLEGFSISAREATTRIYDWSLADIKQQISELKSSLKDVEDPTTINEMIKELSDQEKTLQKEYDNFLKSNIKDVSFKNKWSKTTHEKVTEVKIIQGNWTDKFLPDSFLASKDPYFKFLVGEYLTYKVKYDKKVLEVENTMRDLLKDSRKSEARSIKDRIIPTDDIVIEYLEAEPNGRVDMILDGKLTKENLELAHYVQQLFMEYRNELAKRRVMDKFLNEYVTHMNQGVAQVLKYKWIKEAIKQIITKEEHVFDFGALWDRDTVLWQEKFFRFWIERKGMQDYNKDLWQIVMGYTSTFYKKLTLDEVIPKAVLYRDILADSSAMKTSTAWMNNKKGIRIDDLQWSWLDKTLWGLKTSIAILELWFNGVTALASTAWVTWANYALLWWVKWKDGIVRKSTKQGKDILKEFEGTLWKNPLWNIKEELLNAPDVTPLQMPIQLAFSMLWQVFKSGMNTAFLGLLTKNEFKTGKVSNERVAEIMLEMGKYHAMPWTSSIYGSTLIGGQMMMYKWWSVPLLYTNIKLWNRLSSGKSIKEWTFKKDAGDFYRSMLVPVAMLVLAINHFSEDNDQTYLEKRFIQELTSAVWAANPKMWFALPRVMGKIWSILNALMEMIYDEDSKTMWPAVYKSTKAGEYEKGDWKGMNHLLDQFVPWFIKQFGIFAEQLDWSENKKKKQFSEGLDELSELDELGELDSLSELSELDDL